MQLSDIETLLLQLIGYDRYSDLSASTDAEKMEDFTNIHKCIWIARTEIARNTYLPGILKHATSITTVASQKRYTITDSDFDIPVKARYTTSSEEYDLTKANPNNILSLVSKTTDTGTPTYYMMFGSTAAGLSYVELYPIPETAGETVDIDYVPVLENLTTSTDEDLIMKKYPETVLKIASAWAFQIIKKDMADFEKWLLLGRADFKVITLRESNADPKLDARPDELLITRRVGRRTI